MGESGKHTKQKAYEDISQSTFAEEKRKLLDVIDKIRDIGGDLIPQLPRIVVIGNQSAGKSSLIEAIARINVPRDMGTCTRCPSEIRLRSSTAEWECCISLRFEYDKNGQKLQDVRTVPFGHKFSDRSQVEPMLRRAQLAILSPSTKASRFLKVDLENHESPSELNFSRNVICIEVTGPGLTDLTFVDLPGIISSVQDTAQTDLIELIKSMVREYITGNSIILVAITMRDDIDNQAAILEARQADPDGTRTIGVLTKPDTLQKGEETQWLPVVQNIKSHLRLGYYVTKQPSPAEVKQGITFDTARQVEQDFFKGNEPWATLPRKVIERLGTPRLTSSLSVLLTDAIKGALPGITDKINENLTQAKEDLSSLPKEPSNNPVGDMLHLCQPVYTQLDDHTAGTKGCVKLLQRNKQTFRQFKIDVRATAPAFVPYTKKELKNTDVSYAEPEFLAEDASTDADGDSLHLDDVRKFIEAESTRELPFSVPFSAKVSMMLLPVQQWPEIVDICFENVVPDVENLCSDIVKKAFGQFEHGPVMRLVEELIADTILELKLKTKDALKVLLAIEEYPSTQNDHYFTTVRARLMAHYREKRKQRKRKASAVDDNSPASPAEDDRAASVMAAIKYLNHVPEFRGVSEEDLGKLLPDDPFTQEIVVMAETRAYFQVAYKRIIDNVPHAIHQMFIHPLARAVYDALISGPKINTVEAVDKCREYLQESRHTIERRETLQSTRKRLERAKAELRLIGL